MPDVPQNVSSQPNQPPAPPAAVPPPQVLNGSMPAQNTPAGPQPVELSQTDIENARSVLDILLAEHLITKEQYEEVKVESATKGHTLIEVLIERSIVPEERVAEAQAKLLGIPYIDLSTASFSPQALNFLSQAVVERFNLIPFHFDDKTKTLSVAMANPVDLDAMAFIRQKTSLNIKSFAASPAHVKKAIDQQYKQEIVGEVGEAIKETEQYTAKKKVVDSKKISELITEAPIAKIVSTILDFAVSSRASDVHIEPQDETLRVRYRIDGILYDKLSLPKNVQDQLISRIKILAELKLDEHRIPQDGRFTFTNNGDDEVDLRVSTLPTVKGEKIVLRLLRKSGGIPTLQELGLRGTALRSLESAILRPHGVILVCGPTGSGKTTTLYSVLSRLNTTRVNIASLEDPVEYEIAGVNQVQINPAVGLTFASGLRSFLRQDPNIILVGEIRDKETTELAIQAALTGHLVFSTLHTSTAAGALPRLVDLGAEGFLLASTINAIAGQRIVRKICTHCVEEYDPPAPLLDEMKHVLGPLFPQGAIKLHKGKGCSECGNMGYMGRVGIYEVLPASEAVSRLIVEHADATKIGAQAAQEGMITMKQDGYLKVLQGETTIEEVLRVAQD